MTHSVLPYLRLSAFICGLCVFCFPFPAVSSITQTDDAGREVRLAAPAQRIVSLAPFLTELVYSAGAGARLVAVSAHSDYPPQARQLPEVSSAVRVDLERIALLKPDLVLAWRDSVRPEDVERLEKLGIAVFVTQPRRLEDVPRLLSAVGTLAGADVTQTVRRYRERLDALRERHARARPIAVFVEIWHRPLTTVAGPHWINEALALCGARNVFDDLAGVAPRVSWEALYARSPEAIVGAGSAPSRAAFEANWRSRATLPAVKAGRLVFVDPDLLQRPTLRLAQGVEQLCEGLQRLRQ